MHDDGVNQIYICVHVFPRLWWLRLFHTPTRTTSRTYSKPLGTWKRLALKIVFKFLTWNPTTVRKSAPPLVILGIRRMIYDDVMTWKLLFCITSPLWWKSLGQRWIPSKRLIMWTFYVSLFGSLNNILNKQPSCRWYEKPWRSCDVTVMDHMETKMNPNYTVNNRYNIVIHTALHRASSNYKGQTPQHSFSIKSDTSSITVHVHMGSHFDQTLYHCKAYRYRFAFLVDCPLVCLQL